MRIKKIEKLVSLIFVLIMSAMLAACAEKAKIPDDYNYGDFSKYIKLPDYKGIEYSKVTGDVSDQEVKDYIDQQLANSEESEQIKEGTVEKDSIVNIDYVGSIDGVEFEGGTAQGQELDIANSGYIDGFAEGIVGHKVGETFDLHVTFPENYGKEELNGKDAVFKTTINYLVKKKKAEYSDDWVKDNTEYKTKKEYEEYVKNTLSEEKLSSADSAEKNEVFTKISEGSEVIEYPEKELNLRKDQVNKLYQDYAKSLGMELGDFIKNQMGMDDEQFSAMVDESAKNTVRMELILHAIKSAENIEIKQSGYDEFLENTLKTSGLTEGTFKEKNGKSLAEYAIENNMFASYLYSVVMDKVMEYSVGK